MYFNYLGAVLFCRLLNVQSNSYITPLSVFFSSSVKELNGDRERGQTEIASNVTILSFCIVVPF